MSFGKDSITVLSCRIIITLSCFILAWIFAGNAIQERSLLFNMIGGVLCLIDGAVAVGKPIADTLVVPSRVLFHHQDPTGGRQPRYSTAKAKRKKVAL